MRTAIFPMLLICAILFGFNGRDTITPEAEYRPSGDWYGPTDGADVLFIFLGYDDYDPDNPYVCGDQYWNPDIQEGGYAWGLNWVCGSWTQPDGFPYHWNGGLGSAMDYLGYTWHWFPGYTGRCGQVIPSASFLNGYDVVFVMTFDAFRSTTVTSSTREILETYMQNGGHVILISQDAKYSGVPEEWLNQWFDTGAIQQDVVTGTNPINVIGLPTSFLMGWYGTSLMPHFSSGCGGLSAGCWWVDSMDGFGCIGNGDWMLASYSEFYESIYSSFDFETCNFPEVLSISEIIMSYMGGSSLERDTWGAIKASF